jgi:DNA-binding MarR family transcriptional regulator
MAEIDGKIVDALARVSQAFRVLLRNEGKLNELSPIQIQILIFLLFQSGQRSKVTALARQFDLTKATISDSIKSLTQKCLVEKCVDSTDIRSYMIVLTGRGRELALKSAGFASAVEKPLDILSPIQKEIMFTGLLQLIRQLHQAGIISIQKMCLTCCHYDQTGSGHYCKLLKSGLANTELKLDCADHQPSL